MLFLRQRGSIFAKAATLSSMKSLAPQRRKTKFMETNAHFKSAKFLKLILKIRSLSISACDQNQDQSSSIDSRKVRESIDQNY
jgi:hypothetical protein